MIDKGHNEQYLSSMVIDCAHLRIGVLMWEKNLKEEVGKVGGL